MFVLSTLLLILLDVEASTSISISAVLLHQLRGTTFLLQRGLLLVASSLSSWSSLAQEDDQVLASSTASRCDCWRGLRLRDNLENVFALARGYDLSFAELRSGSAAYPYTHAHALHLRGQQQAVSATYRQFQTAATFLDRDLENVCEFWFDRSNAVFWALQYFSLLYEEDEEQYFSTARTGRTGLQLYKCAPGEALLSILCWERLRSVKVLGGGGGATRSDHGADRKPQSVSKLLASVLAKTAAGIATAGGRSEDDEERPQESNEQSRQTHEGQGPAEWQTAVAPSPAWQMEIVLYQYFAAWSACWVPAGREGSSETSASVNTAAGAATSSWKKNLPRMDEMLKFYDDYMRTTTRQINDDHAQLRRNYRGGEAEGAGPGRQAGVEPFFLSASAAAVESLGLCGYGSVVSVDDGREQENSTETFSSSGCALVAAFTSTQDNQAASQRHCQQKLLDFHYFYGSEDLRGKLELQRDAPPSQPPKKRPHDQPPETLLYHRGDCFLLRCSSRDRLVKSFRPTFLNAAQRKEMQFDVRTRQWTFLPRRANNYTSVPAAASPDSDHLGETASNPILLKLRVKPSSRFFVFSKLCGTAAWIADYAQLAWEAKLEEAATARDPTRHQHRFRQDWAFSLRGEREAIAAAGARELGSDEQDDLDSGSGRAQVHPIYSLFGAEVKHGWHWNLKMQLSGTASAWPSREGDQNHGSDSSSFCRRGRMTATTGEREFFGNVERPAPLQFAVDNEISGADLELALSLQQTGAKKAELLAAVEVRCHAFIVWPNEADLLAELVEAVLPYCDGNASVIVAGGDDSNSTVEETIRTFVADVLALKSARKGTRTETEADPTSGAAVNIFDLVKVFSSGDPPRPNASSAVHNHMAIQPDEWFPGKPKGNTDRNLLQKMHLGMVAVADSIARERGAAWSAEKPVWHCFIESDTYFIPENFKRFLFSRRYVDVEAGVAGAASATSSIGGGRETNKSATGSRSSTFTTRPRRWVGLTHNHRVHSEGYLFEPLQSGCFSEDALLDYATFLREREATRREGEQDEANAKANADPPQEVAVADPDYNSCVSPFDPAVNMMFLHVFSACVKESRVLDVTTSETSSSMPPTAQTRMNTVTTAETLSEMHDSFGRGYWSGALNLMPSFQPAHWTHASWPVQLPQLRGDHDHWLLMNGRAALYWRCLGDELEEAHRAGRVPNAALHSGGGRGAGTSAHILTAAGIEAANANEVSTILAESMLDEDEQEGEEIIIPEGAGGGGASKAQEGTARTCTPSRSSTHRGTNLISRYAISFDGHTSLAKGVFHRTARKQNFPIAVLHRMIRLREYDCPAKLCGTLNPVVWGREEEVVLIEEEAPDKTREQGQADDERRISTSGRGFPGEMVVGKKLTTITVETIDNDKEKQIVNTDAQSSVLVGLAFCWEHLLAESARLDFAAMDVARNALFWAFLWSCGLAWGETGGPLSLQARLRITSAALGIGFRQTGGDASEVVEKAQMHSAAGHGQRKRVVEKIEACWVKLAVDTRAELALAPATLARYLAAHCFDG